PHSRYAAGAPERAYELSTEGQKRVIDQAREYDPSFTVNTNPDAVNGPPIVTKGGIVLGGNSRAMSTKLLYGGAGDPGPYRQAIEREASSFGISPDEVARMRQPVLVRELSESPKSIEEGRRLASEMNKPFTAALALDEQAVRR